jgi:mandelate racemase
LRSPDEVASEAVELREEGGFRGLKLRLGRERLADDLATIDAVREAVGSEMSLMVDFNQGLQLGEALERCHAIDELGLAWIEEPIVYHNLEGYARLAADLKTPIQIGENFSRRRTDRLPRIGRKAKRHSGTGFQDMPHMCIKTFRVTVTERTHFDA